VIEYRELWRVPKGEWEQLKPTAHKDYAAEREQQRRVQRFLLERLRYRGYERRGTLGLCLQRLGDWGRKHFFDPRRMPTSTRWW
jgi:hypothetical protein